MILRIFALMILMIAAAPLPARAQDDSRPIFTPTSAWLVGPSRLTAQGEEAGLPCLMANQYDNGYMVRLAGGGNEIMAMVIDFRQAVFTAGQSYPVTLAIAPDFDQVFKASAYNEATLIVNTQGNPDFYEGLRAGSILKLVFGQKSFEFLLLGARDGLERMEACFGGTEKRAALPAKQKQPVTRKAISTITTSEEKMTAIQDRMKPAEPVLLPAMLPEDEVSNAEEEPAAAPSGFSLDKILQTAANNIQGPKIRKPVPEGEMSAAEKTTRDKEAERKAKEQEQQQAAQPGNSISALKKDAVPRDIFVPAPARDMKVSRKPSAPRQWQAVKGADLREVLDVWAREENVELIWSAAGPFPVASTVTVNGTFEEAVQSVLDQYGDAKGSRPVGRIYNDPGMQQKILLITPDKE